MYCRLSMKCNNNRIILLQFILILVAFTIPSLVQCRRDREAVSSGITNYKTDGSERHEELEADGTIKGHYSYVDPTGKKVRVSYSAGKNGFQVCLLCHTKFLDSFKFQYLFFQATGNHFAQFNMGDAKDEYVDESDDDSYDEDTHTFYHKEKPTYQSNTPTYRPSVVSNKKSAISYVNQESSHDDNADDDDDSSDHYYSGDSSSSHYKKPSYKSESPKYQSYNPPTSYANSNLSPSKHHSSETSNKFGLNSPKYKNSNEGTSYVNRENEHLSSGSYSSPPKYGFSSGSSSDFLSSQKESPKYENQHDGTSYVNHETDHYSSHAYDDRDNDDDDDDEYIPPVRSTTAAPSYTFRPHASRIPFTPKYTTPTPVYLEPEEIKPDIITTKFNVKHPVPSSHSPTSALGDLAEDEEYVAIPIPKKSRTSPIKFPSVKTKTTYSYSEHIDTKPYEGADNLKNFDTTKLLDDYHKNQPSKLPAITATKFTIEDVADPYKPKYTSNDYNFKQNNKPPSTIQIEEFQPSFNLQEGKLYSLDGDDSSNKELQKLLAQQEQFSDDHVRLQLNNNNKGSASLGQYQQYLKSQEDEQIEQQFLREQFKIQEQKQKRRPLPMYARPFNKFHPGRRPPKRPSKTGTYRTTIKIPYGFHFRL